MVGRMLLWINGPFGGGKTATAFELSRRLPGGVVCDPELVGFGMHRMLPRALRTDYQDLPPWRESVRYLLAHTLRSHPGPVIVPMTLINAKYFHEIIGGLRADGADVRHFSLLAERETTLRRIRRGRPSRRRPTDPPGPGCVAGRSRFDTSGSADQAGSRPNSRPL